MRLIQNMGTIAEYPQAGSTPSGDSCGSGRPRLIKIAVVGASGVGKTALVVRFLTKRFIGDYERNAERATSLKPRIESLLQPENS
ncbi:ras-like protein family member 11B [Zootoca vivipara]|uniref:ras-like protein family member 11B n=1 Tax=Zootoca vivipara TaxID=8524 RepID=UPI00293B9A35|nr:ras-like protein family member 11B [Zootoca vivipara]